MTHATTKESHPLVQRITHWVHLLSMVVLAFTGFYIHNPFFDGDMMMARTLHFVFMYIVLIALVARVYFALFSKSALMKGSRETGLDIKNFVVQKENRGQFWQTIKYYLFLRKTHPITGKYNPLQKLTYVTIMVLLVLQAFTGFALYGPYVGTFQWLSQPLGGLMIVRQIHYLNMWVFILITMIHLYLSVAEDAPAVKLMFLGKETPAED